MTNIYEKLIHYNEDKEEQVRLIINEFKGAEYLHLRKYYMDFGGDWAPSNEGISIPLTIDNSKELFVGLVEILSLAESKTILEEHFKEQLDLLYNA